MIEKIAYKLVEQMGRENITSSDMKEYYIYGIVTFVERCVTVATIIVISVICKVVIPTLLFLLFFFELRKRTGGYHAEKFSKCYIGTIVTYIGVVYICPILVANEIVMYGLVMCAVLLILIIGTINHPNMALDEEELRELNKTARYVLLLECTLFIAFTILNVHMVCIVYMAMAIILCAILLCIAKILKQQI